METLVHDIRLYLFTFITAADRITCCSVSTRWREYAMASSIDLGLQKHLYVGDLDVPNFTSDELAAMFSDYHLLCRCKPKFTISNYTACMHGSVQVAAHVMIRNGALNMLASDDNGDVDNVCEIVLEPTTYTDVINGALRSGNFEMIAFACMLVPVNDVDVRKSIRWDHLDIVRGGIRVIDWWLELMADPTTGNYYDLFIAACNCAPANVIAYMWAACVQADEREKLNPPEPEPEHDWNNFINYRPQRSGRMVEGDNGGYSWEPFDDDNSTLVDIDSGVNVYKRHAEFVNERVAQLETTDAQLQERLNEAIEASFSNNVPKDNASKDNASKDNASKDNASKDNASKDNASNITGIGANIDTINDNIDVRANVISPFNGILGMPWRNKPRPPMVIPRVPMNKMLAVVGFIKFTGMHQVAEQELRHEHSGIYCGHFNANYSLYDAASVGFIAALGQRRLFAMKLIMEYTIGLNAINEASASQHGIALVRALAHDDNAEFLEQIFTMYDEVRGAHTQTLAFLILLCTVNCEHLIRYAVGRMRAEPEETLDLFTRIRDSTPSKLDSPMDLLILNASISGNVKTVATLVQLCDEPLTRVQLNKYMSVACHNQHMTVVGYLRDIGATMCECGQTHAGLSFR